MSLSGIAGPVPLSASSIPAVKAVFCPSQSTWSCFRTRRSGEGKTSLGLMELFSLAIRVGCSGYAGQARPPTGLHLRRFFLLQQRRGFVLMLKIWLKRKRGVYIFVVFLALVAGSKVRPILVIH